VAGTLLLASCASREPIADNATEARRARNRRVEIFVGEAAPG
jgi:flagellar motor protein MotB